MTATEVPSPPSRRGRRLLTVGAIVIALVAGGGAIALTAARPTCAAPQQVLGVVPGSRFDANGPLPARATAAMRAFRLAGGYEGVWVERGGVFVGVYGPTWAAARAAAKAVATVPGPEIRYICEAATERQLLATQRSIETWPLHRNLLESSIDVRTATVTVTIDRSAPQNAEADLTRRYGPTVAVTRADRDEVDFGPGTGRMPLATDAP